jgi:uncharacterized protein (DUF1697 family)
MSDRYAAFLRGINVAGRRAASEELRACFAALGFDRVATFRASGNVVFASDGGRPGELAERIEPALAAALGYEVRAFLRTDAEMRAMAELRPFPADAVEASAGKLQVIMLLERPPKRVRDEMLALATEEDRLAFGDRELYWLPSGGMLESSLDRRGIEKAIGPTTTRTKGTVDLMAGKYFSEK